MNNSTLFIYLFIYFPVIFRLVSLSISLKGRPICDPILPPNSLAHPLPDFGPLLLHLLHQTLDSIPLPLLCRASSPRRKRRRSGSTFPTTAPPRSAAPPTIPTRHGNPGWRLRALRRLPRRRPAPPASGRRSADLPLPASGASPWRGLVPLLAQRGARCGICRL